MKGFDASILITIVIIVVALLIAAFLLGYLKPYANYNPF